MAFQWSRIQTVIVDNDKKKQSKTVTDACEKSDINVWPGAGQVKDRTRTADITFESADKLGDFSVNPVNSPDCMIQDQIVNNTWNNIVGGLYNTFDKRKPYRKLTENYGVFYTDIISSFENLSQEKIRSAIDIPPKIMETIIVDLLRREIDFREII